MSDVDPDMPDYLVDAILSERAPSDAVDLVKDAFTWRTVDAELMELGYDSVLDDAGVRDASARRTLEFSLDEISLVVEVDGRRIDGSLEPAGEGTASILDQGQAVVSSPIEGGRFTIEATASGPVQLQLTSNGRIVRVPTFVVS